MMDVSVEVLENAEMKWTRPPKLSKAAIDRAGEDLVSGNPFADFLAADVVNEWRSAHAFPLNTAQITLRARAKRIDAGAIVAQRLKRISSIQGKLNRQPKMRLSQMQDIGGCRAIMDRIDSVRVLAEKYEQDGFGVRNDYITEPKADGYRGIHLIWKYESQAPQHAAWNGYRVEIQLRTRMQHAFSTAVETVTTFTQQPLKFGGGDLAWRRFFALVGNVMARWEHSPTVPGTPEDPDRVRPELRLLEHALQVRHYLEAWAAALKHLPTKTVQDAQVYLLILDPLEKTIQTRTFRSAEQASAQALLFEKEIMSGKSPVDAVVVSAKSVNDLRRAYPNYYVDTKVFLQWLRKALT